MKPFAIAVVLLLGCAAGAGAQPSVSASIGGTFSAYREGQTDPAPQQDVRAAAGFEHLFDDERGRISYDLDGGTYAGSGDWSYYLHTAGFTYRFGREGATDRRIYVNSSLVLRRNGDAWAAADYTSLGAGLNAELHPGANVTVRTGYRADYRSFSDLSALTQFEHRGFASLLANLQTRTTLIGEVHVGGKSYAGQILTDPLDVPEPAETMAQIQGRGQGAGLGLRRVEWTAPQAQSQSGTGGLVSGLFRIAQSLSDRTGVHAQTAIRATFGAVPPGLVTTPAGFFDDGVYDDPYASDAAAIQAGFTRELGRGARLEATAAWADRRYTATIAVDASGDELPGSPLRHDRVWRGGVVWSQPVLASRTGNAGLTLEIGYRFIQSRSNDAFYDYMSHGIGLGVSIEY